MKFLSDQGKQFLSNLVKETCEYLVTTKINTTAYHLQTNGLTEKFNVTLCQILSNNGKENQTNWDELIPTALFAYRTSIKSPFETLYSRTPRLPSDLDIIKPKERYVIEYRKNWEQTKNKINEIN